MNQTNKLLKKDKYLIKRIKTLKELKTDDEILFLLNSIYLDGLEDGRQDAE